MAYDGENRPLSVTMANSDTTAYVYGAEGKRLTRVETVKRGAILGHRNDCVTRL